MRQTVVGIATVITLAGVAAGGCGAGTLPDQVVSADALYDRWQGEFDFAAYEPQLRGAIALWEEALALGLVEGEEEAQVWIRLSRAYFELAEAYLPAVARREAYAKGEAAALAALRCDPVFVQVERTQGLRAALGAAQEVGAVFWYGNNLGRVLSYDYLRAALGGTRDVLAAFTRAVALDEGYWGGGPHRALANFLAQTPGFLGGDPARAGAHFARAAELDPTFVQNYVDWADYLARPRGEWDALCALLRTALDVGAEPAVGARWPLYNRLALIRAQTLRGKAPDPCP